VEVAVRDEHLLLDEHERGFSRERRFAVCAIDRAQPAAGSVSADLFKVLSRSSGVTVQFPALPFSLTDCGFCGPSG
jgi:hypothetical protein